MQNPSETLQMGEKQFLVEKVMKETPNSRVCIVRDTEHSERYVYRSFTGTGEVYRRMLGVNSSHLPKIYGVEEENGQVQVLEEYIQGDTLAFLMMGTPLSEPSAKDILLQLCQALKVLHGIGAVHRDIKPENILLRGKEAVLIDFHASRVPRPEHTTDTRILGTIGYAAPEQYGFSQTDGRADIYALGVLLNEMLTLEHPSRRLAEGSLRPVIERCIEVNVGKRFSNITELENAILSGSPKKKSKWIPVVAGLAAVLSLSVFFLGKRTPEVSLPETAEATVVGESTAETEEMQTDLITVSDEVWTGTDVLYETWFQYDLNGDGRTESYVFGLYNTDLPEMYRNTISDTFMVGLNETYQRSVYPCVWHETDDGTLEEAKELTALLEDASITIWRAEGTTAAAPVASQLPAGGIKAAFGYQNMGTWLYAVHATLDGQELTAMGQVQVIPMGSSEDGEGLEPITETEEMQTDLITVSDEVWPGTAALHETRFQYDLDGDGQTESYIFGLCHLDIPEIHRNALSDTFRLGVNDINQRRVYPCVWYDTDDGTLEEAKELTALLEDASITIWRAEGNTAAAPVVSRSSSGGIYAFFGYENLGTWLYAVHATLDGQELTAMGQSNVISIASSD